MSATDDRYVYFRPGEILYIISHDRDQLLNEQPDKELARPTDDSGAMGDQPGSEPGNLEPESQPLQADNELNQDEPKEKEENNDGNNDHDDENGKNRTPSFDENVDELIGWSNGLAQGIKSNLKISRRSDRDLHIPGTHGLAEISLSTKVPPSEKYTSPPLTPRGAISLITAEVQDLSNPNANPEGYVDPVDLAKLIVKLDDEGKSQPLSKAGIKIEVITPNWLSSPCSEVGGGGGPGAHPVPYTGSTKDPPYKFQFQFSEEIKNKLRLISEKERGRGVRVAILDTAPCLHELSAAYEVYYKVDPEKRKKQEEEKGLHPLIGTLLGPNGHLHVHPASHADLLRLRNIHLKDHNYQMTDHGLFVAGIVNTIAPAADIHLYEVLNPEGVGDLETLARGLWKVAEEPYRLFKANKPVPPLVVNCSLVFNIPIEGDPSSPNSARPIQGDPSLKLDSSRSIVGHRLTDLDRVPAILDKISTDRDWIERATMIIMAICDILFYCGSRVIAAAGNDGKIVMDTDGAVRQERPLTRYPAAFTSVQGVGALPIEQPNPQTFAQTPKYEVSSYSDLADRPERKGIVTLGGEPGERKGVLGVYIGEFPAPVTGIASLIHTVLGWFVGLFGGKLIYPANTNHWAWWAGTSFATPILTGVLAAVLSHPKPHPTTEHAIAALYNAGAIEENRTYYTEDLLEAKQVPESEYIP
jgi:subtilisin family serine protease